ILVFVSSIGMLVESDVMGGSKVALNGNVIQNQFLGSRDWPFGYALYMIFVAVYYTHLPGNETGRKCGMGGMVVKK
ncbi:hypothetical protein NPX88_29390, partial [Bacillus mycoides]|nr:hypothetical protein [Bacillus mycoides]